MGVARFTDETGATFYDDAEASHIDKKIAEFEDFDGQPERVKKAWLETWAEEVSGDSLTGLKALDEMTKFLKQNKKRSTLTDKARRQLFVAELSIPLAEALKEEHTVPGNDKVTDKIAAAREILGIPYATLATWLDGSADKAVIKEIKKRATAPATSGSSAPA